VIKVAARAAAGNGNRWTHFTVVACKDEMSCHVVENSRFNQVGEALAAGPRAIVGTSQRVFAIWSDREIADEAIQRAAQAARAEHRSLPALDALPLEVSSWPQVAVTVDARQNPSPR